MCSQFSGFFKIISCAMWCWQSRKNQSSLNNLYNVGQRLDQKRSLKQHTHAQYNISRLSTSTRPDWKGPGPPFSVGMPNQNYNLNTLKWNYHNTLYCISVGLTGLWSRPVTQLSWPGAEISVFSKLIFHPILYCEVCFVCVTISGKETLPTHEEQGKVQFVQLCLLLRGLWFIFLWEAGWLQAPFWWCRGTSGMPVQ